METATQIVETAEESTVGTETPSQVETSAQLSEAEIAELIELKKSKTHFQSVADSKIAEANKKAMEEQLRREMLEKELESLRNPKPVEKPLTKPVKPVKPPDYDPLDAVTRGTSSYAYEQQYRDYLDALTEYQESLAARNEQKIEERLKFLAEIEQQKREEVQRAQFENTFIGGLQTEGGLDEASAREAFKFFTSKESADFKTLGQIWKLVKAGSPKQPYTAPPSPTGTAGGAQPNPSEYTKNADKSWMYKTKK